MKKITDRKERREIYKERVQEKEDPFHVVEAKARKLADAIRRANHLICYTGAGISTSAKIPDYRGSNGIWTLLAQGKSIGQHDLSLAEPTFTHMALYELHRRKMLRFVVSQNCDGLHLRSGLPRYSLSEVHGNMYVEACKTCKPNVEYWRLFDTTELTARYNHKTNRRCHLCGSPLVDTIVHFGERGSLKWPLNWAGACKQSEETDLILCLGSSLKVLKKYSWLWAMDRPVKKRPKLFIVNLQWTPKDSMAALKVNGKCDDVMRLVMQYLDIEVPAYRRERDPIFVHASMLHPEELHTVSQPMLKAEMEKGEGGGEEELSNLPDISEEVDDDEDNSASQWQMAMKMDRSESNSVGDDYSTSGNCQNNIVKGNVDVVEHKVPPSQEEQETARGLSPCLNVMDLQKRLNRFEEAFNSDSKSNSQSVENISNGNSIKEELPEDSPSTAIICKLETTPPQTEPLPEEVKSEISEFSLPSTSRTFPLCSTFSDKTNSSYEAPTAQQLSVTRFKKELCDNLFANQAEIETKLKITEAIQTLYKFESSPGDYDPSSSTMSYNDMQLRSMIASGWFSGYFENSISNEQINSVDLTTSTSTATHKSSSHYEHLLRIYKSLESTLPHWNNPKYAYSGLHSIILPPPPELNLWGSVVIPIIQPRKEKPPAPPPECSFCFESYGERVCQFYEPKRTEFKKVSERKGRTIVCECCDHSEVEEEEEDQGMNNDQMVDEQSRAEVLRTNGRRKSNELNEISNNLHRKADNEEEAIDNGRDEEKMPQVQGSNGGDQKENGSKVVQAGWYGKGYRKYRQRRRKS